MILYKQLLSIVNRFRDIAGFLRRRPLFLYTTPIPAKIWGVPFGVDP